MKKPRPGKTRKKNVSAPTTKNKKKAHVEAEENPLTAKEKYHKDTGLEFPRELSERDRLLMKKNAGLKLPLELIPTSQTHKSLHHHLDWQKWDTIRHRVYRRSRKNCEICGGRGGRHPVECHEIWSYDMDTLVQKLERLQALCPYCHRVKHMGATGVRGKFKKSLERFRSINRLQMQTAKDIVTAAQRRWIIRSAYQWTMDISHISKYGMDPADFKIDWAKMARQKKEAKRWSRQLLTERSGKHSIFRHELDFYRKSLRKKKKKSTR